jgi:hypothetical protein
VYDSALYHVQSIRWATAYPAIPGIGNLHGRLAFNSHFFLLCGLFDGTWLGLKNGFPLNSLVVLLLLWRMMARWVAAYRQGDGVDFLFYLMNFGFALFFLVKIVHSPTPDVFVAVLIWWVLIWIKDFKEGKTTSYIVPLALCFLAPTVKLSAIFTLCFLPVFLQISLRNVLKIAALGAVMLLPFLMRNYVLSGWLVYPFPSIDLFQVDWKIPLEQVIAEKQFIESWSRIFAYDMQRTLAMPLREWLPYWWAGQAVFWKSILLLNILSIVLLLLGGVKRNFLQRWEMGLTGALLINVAFWFKTAPDPRFAAGFLLGNAALAASYCVRLLPALPTKVKTTGMNAAFLFLYLAVFGLIGLKAKSLTIKDLYQPRPMEQIVARRYNWTGWPLWIPEVGERCFDCPIPCAPQVNERLRLRGKDLREGLTVR